MNPEKDNTFCWYPFDQLAVKKINEHGHPMGITPCCNAAREEDSDPMKLDGLVTTESLDEIFHSAPMQQLRKDMLSNVKNPICQTCWAIEDKGIHSYRLNSYPRLLTPEQRLEFIKAPQLDAIDITSSLKCNLRCRMCSPGASHKIQTHERAEFETMGVLDEVTDLTGMDFNYYNPTMGFRTDSPQLQMIRDGRTKVRHLKVSGGEPLYDGDFIDFLHDAVSHNPNMILGLHTNATQFSKRVIDVLNRFKMLDLTFSIDGHGKVYDYIRHPVSWSQLNASIDRFLANITTQYEIRLNTVYQVYNIMNLDDLLRWGMERGWFMTLSDVFPYSRSLNIRSLPNDILMTAIDRIKAVDTSSYPHPHKIKTTIQNLEATMRDRVLSPDAAQRVARETALFDTVKGQDYREHLDPQIVDWINRK